VEKLRRWLVDTGCPIDLIANSELNTHEKEYVFKTSDFVRLHTANGINETNKILRLDVKVLGDLVEAHVLSSTPTVMSVGKRCVKMGYNFIWRHG
jgi:hypothetical protein